MTPRKPSLFLFVVFVFLVALMVLGFFPGRAPESDRIHIAVASNFTGAMESLAVRFKEQTGHEVVLSHGSTGMLYAQIRNGAPFDAFFAADAERPALLDSAGVSLPGSRFTYAVGRIALWSPQAGRVDPDGAVLRSGEFRHLALANPELAPYGRAARTVLQATGDWDRLEPKRVVGQNIAQTYQFVESGNAELGFVAYSQLVAKNHAVGGGKGSKRGSYWLAPQSMYAPIAQQAVVLKDGPVVRAFMDFVRSEDALEMIRGFGYATERETTMGTR